MKAIKLLSAVLMTGAVFPALACDVPSLVQIPEEESARANYTTLIQVDAIRYISAMSSYVDCLGEAFETASADDASSLQLSLLASRNNLAVAELEAVQKAYVASMGPIEELAEIEREECIDGGNGLVDIIVDDQTIVFYTRRRGEIFLNRLAESCPMLRANNSTLTYAVSKSARFVEELCSSNPLTDSSAPARARRCVLDWFYPISENEAEQLRSR